MIESTGESGRDEQRDDWNDAADDLVRDAMAVSGDLLWMGLPAYSWVIDSVQDSVKRAGDGLSVRDR